MDYDKRLIKDIWAGRLETVDRLITKNRDYRELAEKQKEQWSRLEGMGLSDEALEAASEYADMSSRQASRYSELMYEMGIQDGLRLGKMQQDNGKLK